MVTGLDINTDGDPNAYDQDKATKDNEGACHIQSRYICPFTSKLVNPISELGPDPPIV